MKIEDIARIIEAVVFVSGDGVDKDEFKRIYDLSDKELNKCLDILKQKYNEDSGINIIMYKNKIQLCSNPTLVDNVAEILNPIRERSLTKSALETIAIIAYKQPITRTEIEQIRGVNSDYAMQLLQSNNLIEVVGRKDTVGKPLLFGTTDNFLKRFELESIDDLPNHKELLDRIRVIHSEGDSLYREFDIPDETNAENGNEVNQSTEDTQDDLPQEQNIKIDEENNNDIRSMTPVQKAESDGVINNQNILSEQKISWRDKMKAKMSENSDNYGNLDRVLEKKN
ncbi:MAG: SMC-Scp complex subunit ScpB [Clostridia bacterium]